MSLRSSPRASPRSSRALSMENSLVIIPARHAAHRFPGKMLAPLNGRSVIEYSWRAALAARGDADAVFVANDHMAFSVLDTLRHELGLRVPEDVSVIGYDDVLAASWPSYDLTTVRQPADQMVDQTVEILMQQINDGDMTPRRVQIDGPLVIRGSTRQPDVVKG